MLYLQPLAYLSNRHCIGARTTLDREKSLILFRRQVCPSGKHFLAETKKLPRRISEGTECIVVLGLERLLHRQDFWRRLVDSEFLGTKRAIFLTVRRGTRSLSQQRRIVRCSRLKAPVEFGLPFAGHNLCQRDCYRYCKGASPS